MNSVPAHRTTAGFLLLCGFCLAAQVAGGAAAGTFEVTPDKKVVWGFNEWVNPDLGPASCIQLLDEPGRDEFQELMR